MNDENTTLAELKRRVLQFVDERDWQQFHAPKNLSMAIAIEAAELMEHFQWIDAAESRTPTPEQREKIGEELADVFCYVLALANELEMDLTEQFVRKMVKNVAKYPADEMRGRFGHDDPRPSQR